MAVQNFGLSLIFRLELENTKLSFDKLAGLIAEWGGDVIALDMIRAGRDVSIRDVTINVSNREHGLKMITLLEEHPGVKVINVSDRTFLLHLGGKIEVNPKTQVQNRDDLSRVYTPQVARVCEAIRDDTSKAYQLTIKRNTVAVVSDGTAVLGLKDIGPYAAMPVMEGKAMLFKHFADVNAFPICLDTKDPEEIIRTVKTIAPAFGGINLEDISSPRCFEIEQRLREELDIPVFHDDQHGTAVVVLAGLINALRIVDKKMEDLKIVVLGIGAAGVASTKMLQAAGAQNILCVTRKGILVKGTTYDNPMWNWSAENTNPNHYTGTLEDAMKDADVFIGLSGANLLDVEYVKTMARDPIVIAMANPVPEITPEEAEPYVRVMATGRSDYPNQINNVLCFPGIFKGALSCRAHTINEEMKLAAAEAIASVVRPEELSETYIIPSVFNKKVVEAISHAVSEAAYRTGVARRERLDTGNKANF